MLHDTRVSIRLTPGSHATQHPGVRYAETRVSYKLLLQYLAFFFTISHNSNHCQTIAFNL